MLFESNRTYKFRHLQNAGLVRDRDDLKNKQDNFNFPTGKLLTPRDRQWTGRELNGYLEKLPTTQAEFAARFPNRVPAKSSLQRRKHAARARRHRQTPPTLGGVCISKAKDRAVASWSLADPEPDRQNAGGYFGRTFCREGFQHRR
jgi:hypothetical protein